MHFLCMNQSLPVQARNVLSLRRTIIFITTSIYIIFYLEIWKFTDETVWSLVGTGFSHHKQHYERQGLRYNTTFDNVLEFLTTRESYNTKYSRTY
jgi:hypothetical protein